MTIDKGINVGGGAGERGARSPIEFRLDPGSGVPTYLQLVQQVERGSVKRAVGRPEQTGPRAAEQFDAGDLYDELFALVVC